MAKYTIELRKICDICGRDEVEKWFKDYDINNYLTPTQIEQIQKFNVWSKDRLATKIVDHYFMREIGFETPALFKHYAKVKMQETCKKRYGSTSYAKTQEFRDFINDNKNSINAKQYNTKKKNNSFNVSSKEEQLFKLLLIQYPDVIRQYKSSDYPYSCDFYIPSLELYIELNGM